MPVVKMELSAQAHKEYKMMKRKMGYSDDDLFLKYCVLKAVKPFASERDKKDIAKEIRSIQAFRKK